MNKGTTEEKFLDLINGHMDAGHCITPYFLLVCSRDLNQLPALNTLLNEWDIGVPIGIKWKLMVMMLKGTGLIAYRPPRLSYKPSTLKKFEAIMHRYYQWTLFEAIKNKSIVPYLPLRTMGFTLEEIDEILTLLKGV